MKVFTHRTKDYSCQRALGGGFTLVEMMVSMSLFSLVVIGMTYAHMFGLRQDQLIQSKLGASQEARQGFNRLVSDIRSAKKWNIGSGNITTFVEIENGERQEGSALKIYRTGDTNQFIIYYFLPEAGELRRQTSGSMQSGIIATHLTNNMSFRAETPSGATQYELSHKGVICCAMEFAQYQYPLTRVGTGYYYDYYRMSFKVTPHVPDGP